MRKKMSGGATPPLSRKPFGASLPVRHNSDTEQTGVSEKVSIRTWDTIGAEKCAHKAKSKNKGTWESRNLLMRGLIDPHIDVLAEVIDIGLIAAMAAQELHKYLFQRKNLLDEPIFDSRQASPLPHQARDGMFAADVCCLSHPPSIEGWVSGPHCYRRLPGRNLPMPRD
jgi:hypothetical protein